MPFDRSGARWDCDRSLVTCSWALRKLLNLMRQYLLDNAHSIERVDRISIANRTIYPSNQFSGSQPRQRLRNPNSGCD